MKLPAWAKLIHICVLLACLGSSVEAAGYAPPFQQAAEPQVFADEQGLTLEWHTPWPAVQTLANGQILIEIAGFEANATPGALALMQSSALVALPPGAAPQINILEEQSEPIEIHGLVVNVADQPVVQRDEAGQGMGGEFHSPSDIQPPAPPVIAVEEVGIVRGVRLGRVVFTPVHQTEAGWTYTSRLRVRLDYHQPRPSGSTENAPALPQMLPDAIVNRVGQLVINPDQLAGMAQKNALAAPNMQVPGADSAPTVILEVQEAGLTQITYASLEEAGFSPAAFDPQMLQLWHGGGEVAMEWEGDADPTFEPGERFVFYAEPQPSRWAAADTYLLKPGSQPGVRIGGFSSTLAAQAAGVLWRSLLVEKNLIYTPDCYCGQTPRGHDGDRWAWGDLSRPGRPSASYPFSLPSLQVGSSGQIKIWLMSYTSLPNAPVDHRVNIAVNGTSLGQVEWDGKALFPATFTVPAGVFREGQNTLTLTLPGITGVSAEGMWLDAFQVTYAHGSANTGLSAVFTGEPAPRKYTFTPAEIQGIRLYDIRNPDFPVRLTGALVSGSQVTFADDQVGAGRYAAAVEAGLRTPAVIRLGQTLRTADVPGADYLVITHADFALSLGPLLEQRSRQGLVTALEEVQAVYDNYSGGRPSPDAIRAFLSDVYRRWSPRPLYVLLVGDGSTDPKQYHADSRRSWIPPMLADVDPWLGETAADNRYVTVDGDDALPDMMIGRLPVNSLIEAQNVVAKIIRAENQPAPGTWPARITSIADNKDESGNFAQVADTILSPLAAASSYDVNRSYFMVTTDSASTVQKAVMDGFQAGSGVILYTGHASIHQWGAENYFHLSQIPSLTNAYRLPLLLEMDCLTASFQVAGFDTLDESLLRHPNGGVVAAWGSTGLGIATGHSILAKSVIQNLYVHEEARLGMAVIRAKLQLAALQPGYRDLIDTYTVLGDPASLINVQENTQGQMYLPFIFR